MKRCGRCGCVGRVERVSEEGGCWLKAAYICPNPRCGGYKEVFAEEIFEGDTSPGDASPGGNTPQGEE